MAKPILTADRVRELFHYCHTDGALYNKKKRKGVAAGTIAGTVRTDGRVQIAVDGKGYKAHRLVWLHAHGEWPKHQITHINGDCADNRLDNLRDVDRSAVALEKKRLRAAQPIIKKPTALDIYSPTAGSLQSNKRSPRDSADRIEKEAALGAVELRSLMDYDCESGMCTWRIRDSSCFNSDRAARSWNARFAGKVVGTANVRGYLATRVMGRSYILHRLIWLHTYGRWPDGSVDHIDGDPSNNRIQNLRDVPHRTNGENQRVASINNKSGLLGVSFSRSAQKWVAQISTDGKKLHIGCYDSKHDAYEAYILTKRRLHDGCSI